MDEGNEIIQKRSIAGIILIVIAVLSLLMAFMNNISFLPYCVISGSDERLRERPDRESPAREVSIWRK